MTSHVSGGSQNGRMVRFNDVEGTKETKPGVFSQLKTWMKTRLYGSPFGGLLVRYGTRKAMAAVKKHTTAVKLLKEMKSGITASKPKLSPEASTKGSIHDRALGVVDAQLKQAETNLANAKDALSSKEDDFKLLRSKDRESDKNLKANDKIETSRKHLDATGISRHGLNAVSKEIRATIKKEWDPGLFTRLSAEQRKEMKAIKDIILKSLDSNESQLKELKQTKKENTVTLTSMKSLDPPDAEEI